MNRRPALATTLLLVLAATLVAPRGARTAAPAAKASPTRATALPESVLARVGKGRDVTAAEFARAWGQVQPPARPDSLTPEGVREFLDLLVEKEILALHAEAQKFSWSPMESAQYLALRDQLMLKAALDSALHQAKLATGLADSVANAQVLGVAARESLFVRRGVTFDDALLERLAQRWAALPRPSRDSSIWSQLRVMGMLPEVDPADSDLVVATSGEERFRVKDMVTSWKSTNPLSRPRIETAAQVRDLAKNGLYSRVLRREAEARRLDRRPDIAKALAERREYYAVAHLVDREVYKQLPTDSLTLLAWYRDHVNDYDLPDRVRIMRMVLPDRAEAGRMAARLRSPAEAETLLVTGRRAGVNYASEITAETDSATFRAAMRAGAGAVLGPDSLSGGWQVVRVTEIDPARSRTYVEASEMVRNHYYGQQGEARMRTLIDGLRKKTAVTINEPAVTRYARSAAGR